MAIGLDPNGYGTHSLRRTKAALIYRKTGNLRAIPLLLGHSKVDSTVRYLARSIRLQKKGYRRGTQFSCSRFADRARQLVVGRCRSRAQGGEYPETPYSYFLNQILKNHQEFIADDSRAAVERRRRLWRQREAEMKETAAKLDTVFGDNGQDIFTRVLRRTRFAPDAGEAILDGRQGPDETPAWLLDSFSIDWMAQAEYFG